MDLLRGMESVFSPHGYQVTLADSRPGENRITEAVDGLLSMHVEGLVIAAEPSESMMAGTSFRPAPGSSPTTTTAAAAWRRST